MKHKYYVTKCLFYYLQAAEHSADYLRVISQREKQLIPDLGHHASIVRENLRVDFQALGYLEYCPEHVSGLVQPILTRGDGNCLFNALSIAICGNESLSIEIKVRTCIEMSTNQEFYISQPYAKDYELCNFFRIN